MFGDYAYTPPAPPDEGAKQQFNCKTCQTPVWIGSAHGGRRSADLSDQIAARLCTACFNKSKGINP